MKKKIYAVLCGLCIAFSLTACEDEIMIVDDQGNIKECDLYGRFVEIEEIDYYDEFGNYYHHRIWYDKDTKIMYIIETGDGNSISPFYVMNTENEPVIGVYTEAMEITE